MRHIFARSDRNKHTPISSKCKCEVLAKKQRGALSHAPPLFFDLSRITCRQQLKIKARWRPPMDKTARQAHMIMSVFGAGNFFARQKVVEITH